MSACIEAEYTSSSTDPELNPRLRRTHRNPPLDITTLAARLGIPNPHRRSRLRQSHRPKLGRIHKSIQRPHRILAWEFYFGSAGYETVYNTWPTNDGFTIADHKVFLFNDEHSPNGVLWRGAKLWCLDIYTGELLWKSTGWLDSPASQTATSSQITSTPTKSTASPKAQAQQP